MIEFDASGAGLGDVLMQEGRPIAYFSKGLSKQTQAKSTYEKKLMALVLAIQALRPYLLGQKFIVRTDHRSLRHLLHQKIATPAQQLWVAKLLGYDFSVEYKPGISNAAADALSRQQEESSFAVISASQWVDTVKLQKKVEVDPSLGKLVQQLKLDPSCQPPYNLIGGQLYYQGQLVIPSNSTWVNTLLTEFLATPNGGHSGALRTYRRLASSLYCPEMFKVVKKFVASYEVFQKNKYETLSPAGLLQPLPIPDQIWEDLSMDFITSLPKSHGFDCLLIVVDRLSKYGHFILLKHPYTARTVADLFIKEVVKLHGIPKTIVSDCDPIFMSMFWQELFRSMGTKLRMSSAYHPESDGQTEVLNRCVETYLRCFCAEQPHTWAKWISWTEYSYNTSFQTASGTTPFRVVYGRNPPSLLQFMPGECRVQFLAD